MDLGLTGKTALVAAASQGLGAAIATRLAEEGCVVEICSRSLHRAQAKAEEIEADTGASVDGVEVDVADSASIRSWVDSAAERYGALDVVIPNAGGPAQGRFDDTSEEEWDRAYALLLRSAMAFASGGASSSSSKTSMSTGIEFMPTVDCIPRK